nr:MBL fold metallo-hydrolase [Martelella limonii]
MRLGGGYLEKIVDLDPFVLPFDLILPGRDPNALLPHADLLSPDHVDFEGGNLLLSLHSFLLKIGGLTILIDTCVGEHKPRPRRADWNARTDTAYLAGLAAAGVRPEDVDIVMCTHLHADHVGWNTRLEGGRWVPTFPKARYLIGAAELAHWQAEEARAPGAANHGAYTDSVLPVIEAGLVERVEDGFSLGRGMAITGLAGHAPGQIGLDLDCGNGSHAHFCGDAFHSPVQVYHPDWSSRFCHDPALAAALRTRLLAEAAENDTLLLPAHLRNAFGMRIRRAGAGFRPALS